MELSLAVNASLVALSKFGKVSKVAFSFRASSFLQRYSVRSLSAFHLRDASMSAVLTRRERLLQRTLLSRELPVSSMGFFYYY